MDKRYLQANKEAWYSLIITILYLLFWIACAYFLNDKQGIMGFPAWFEASCVLTPLGFIFVCYLIVKYRFKDIPLESDSSQSSNQQ